MDVALRMRLDPVTMRVPADVSNTVNAYLAFRAALAAVQAPNETSAHPVASVLCPGLGTAIGKPPVARCAFQMHAAWLAVEQPLGRFVSLGQAYEQHAAMLHR